MIPEDTDLSSTTKEEETASTNDIIINTCASSRISKQQQAAVVSTNTAASTSSWSRLKDPRIVRVSRAFGGKDRHSKVCTVRGLRDRRVRLSVPTAIQLYDLQDRLGLNQPSKVVDWLLNEAKEAIDELPPLQIPQGSLISSQSNNIVHPMFMNSFLSDNNKGLSSKINNNDDWGRKDKDAGSGESSHHQRHDHQNWGIRNNNHQSQVLELADPSNFLLSSRQSLPFPSLFSAGSYNPNLVRWDPQRSHESASTISQNNEDFHHHNFSLVQLSSSSHIPAGSHPVLVYHQPAAAAGVLNNASGSCHILSATANTDHGFETKQAVSNSSLTSPVQFHTTANLLPNRAVDDEQSNRNNQSFHSS